jgi:lauroyl/myristoyl acyltransferase
MFDNITYRLLRLFIRMVSCIPLPVAQFTGRMLGSLGFLLPMSRKAVAFDNLVQSFGTE